MKRVFWVGVGVGLTVLALRWARKQRQRYGPEAVTQKLQSGARDLRRLAAVALAEGRKAAADKEAELRAALAGER